MTDVFISYAREDQPVVRSLSAALEEHRREAWVDWEGIPPTAEWLAEIEAAIDGADAFLFVMSPHSLASEVCGREVEHAARRNKRLLPVVRGEIEGLVIPEALAKLNWIFLRERDDFAAGVATLIAALDTDLEHVQLHTRYLKRAVDWEHKSFDSSYALRGRDLAAAETWLAESGGKEPRPTSLQNRYILESRRLTTRRQRITSGAIGAGLLVATVLGLLGLQQRAAKRENQQRAIANQLIGESRLASGLEESVQLAAEAIRRLAVLGESSLAADQELRRGLALLPPRPTAAELEIRGETRAVAFNAGGAHLAIATSLGGVMVRDVLAGATVGSWTIPLAAGDSLRAVAVDDAGARVGLWLYSPSSGDSRLSLWDVARGVELTGCDRAGDFTNREPLLGPDGRWWVAGEAWRLDTCRAAAFWDETLILSAATLSGDGKTLAASVRQRGDRQRWIEIRDAETGAELARWKHENAIARLWLLDRGRRLGAVGFGSRQLRLWDVENPGRPRDVELAEPVVAISGDGRAVATVKQNGSIAKIRSSDSGLETLRLVHPAPVTAAAFGPDGGTLTTLAGGRTWRWRLDTAAEDVAPGPADPLATNREEGRYREALAAEIELEGAEILAVAACPDESRLAATVGSMTRGGWQARTEVLRMPGGERLASFDLMETLGGGMRGLDDGAARLLVCSADGRYLAAPARDAAVVRDLSTGRVAARLRHPGLSALAFDPRGEYAATAGRGPVRVWRLATSAEVSRLLDSTPSAGVAFSADGRYLLTAREGVTAGFLWRPEDLIGDACRRLERGLPASAWDLLFPGEPYVATCPERGPG